MRHRVFKKKLSRDINSRRALASNLASSLLVEGHITTTVAKAKFVQVFAEKLITGAARTSLHTRRSLASRLTHPAFIRLITEISPGFEDRRGGYTRIVKLSTRRGDSAPMARIEILEWDKSKKHELSKNPKPAKGAASPQIKPVRKKVDGKGKIKTFSSHPEQSEGSKK